MPVINFCKSKAKINQSTIETDDLFIRFFQAEKQDFPYYGHFLKFRTIAMENDRRRKVSEAANSLISSGHLPPRLRTFSRWLP